MSSNKIWDIVQPVDEWGRGYARLAYEHTGLKQLFTRKIEVNAQPSLLDYKPAARRAIIVIESFKV